MALTGMEHRQRGEGGEHTGWVGVGRGEGRCGGAPVGAGGPTGRLSCDGAAVSIQKSPQTGQRVGGSVTAGSHLPIRVNVVAVGLLALPEGPDNAQAGLLRDPVRVPVLGDCPVRRGFPFAPDDARHARL